MRRTIGTVVVAAILATGCGSGDVSQADYELVVSQLAVANQDLALAKEELALAIESAATADRRVSEAVEDRREAEADLAEIRGELDELFTIDDDEQKVMERQQALAILGNLFVEFRDGPWDETTVEMFGEFVPSTVEPEIIEQLDVFAAAVADDPESESANYEYGILGYSIMAALEREVVDPFGAG